MCIVSLVPAATEIAAALGAAGELVAVTHDCDHPAWVRDLPRITRSTIAAGSESAAIDAAVRDAASRGESTFHLDADALRAARPDFLLGQTLCHVCAVTLAQVPTAWEREPTVVPLEAHSLDRIFDDILRVAGAIGRGEVGTALVAALRARLARVAAAVGDADRPRVTCLEWLSPLFNAGHWVPEQVGIAGAVDTLGMAGERSREVVLADVAAAQPDAICLMPCGFDAVRAMREAAALREDVAWRSLDAVRAGRVYALDGHAYFSRPGPRAVDGAELLASILHRGRVGRPAGASVLRLH